MIKVPSCIESNGPSRPLHSATVVCKQGIGLLSISDDDTFIGIGLCIHSLLQQATVSTGSYSSHISQRSSRLGHFTPPCHKHPTSIELNLLLLSDEGAD